MAKMNTKPTAENEQEKNNLWQFVDPGDFALPAEPAGKAARSFLQKLFPGIDKDEDESANEVIQAELKSAPRSLIDWLAPYPEWLNASVKVEKILEAWLNEDEPEGHFRMFIAPYGSGLGEILQQLAEKKKWKIIAAPTYQQLHSRDFSWLEQLPPKSDQPVVIPRLEAFFLRHYHGLEHIRKLIARLFHSQQLCIAGCNSWLWHYLTVAMRINKSFSRHYYLQSLSAEDLQHFFCTLAAQKISRPTVFRQANNGRFVLPPEITGKNALIKNQEQSSKPEDSFPSTFLKRLAVESRGIPLVAWAIWRNSLKLAPDEDVADIAREEADKDATTTAKAKTIWVKAFADIELPRIPSELGQSGSFLLLFLLQHDGLSADAIFDLLDFDRDQLIGLLNRLEKYGLIVNEDGTWRATWQGYPAIRRFLAEQDQLQDAM